MKIINPDSIHTSEEDFIDTINAELDWEVIEKMLFEKHKLIMQEEVDYKKGDIVVHNDQIAYKFDFDIKVPLSVIFGRDGKCLEISSSGDPESGHNPEAGFDLSVNSTSDIDSSDFFPSKNDNFQDNTVNDGYAANNQDDAQKNSSKDGSDGLEGFEKKDMSRIAADIANMISDINQGDN